MTIMGNADALTQSLRFSLEADEVFKHVRGNCGAEEVDLGRCTGSVHQTNSGAHFCAHKLSSAVAQEANGGFHDSPPRARVSRFVAVTHVTIVGWWSHVWLLPVAL